MNCRCPGYRWLHVQGFTHCLKAAAIECREKGCAAARAGFERCEQECDKLRVENELRAERARQLAHTVNRWPKAER